MLIIPAIKSTLDIVDPFSICSTVAFWNIPAGGNTTALARSEWPLWGKPLWNAYLCVITFCRLCRTWTMHDVPAQAWYAASPKSGTTLAISMVPGPVPCPRGQLTQCSKAHAAKLSACQKLPVASELPVGNGLCPPPSPGLCPETVCRSRLDWDNTLPGDMLNVYQCRRLCSSGLAPLSCLVSWYGSSQRIPNPNLVTVVTRQHWA